MYILSINPVQPGIIWTVVSFPFYVGGAVVSGVGRAISGNPQEQIQYLTQRATSTPDTAPIGTRIYNGLSKLIGCFGSEGRIDVRAANITESFSKNQSFNGAMDIIKKVGTKGNILIALGVIAAIGLVGYGIARTVSGIRDDDSVAHGQGPQILVKDRWYHLALAGLGITMVGSVALIPVIGPAMLGVGLLAGGGALALNTRFVQRHIGGMGIFHRPDDYIPAALGGIHLRRMVDPRYTTGHA